MKQIRSIIKTILFSIIILIVRINNCSARGEKDTGRISIYGKWICVDTDFNGYEQFSLKVAEKIKHSVLNIDRHTLNYSNARFIEPCSYFGFKVTRWDTSESFGVDLEYRYTKKELSKILVFNPVDKQGNNVICYNNNIFLKQDTLINIYGGYIFYFVKSLNFKGTGNASKRIEIPKGLNKIRIDYEFYQEPVGLTIFDEKGQELYSVGMKTTIKRGIQNINLNGVTELIFKVESNRRTAKWSFSIRTE